MALRPWTPEREVDAELARALVEEQFPQFKPARIAHLGEGWDNAVFAANEKWVFRFPRRQMAVPLIEAELKVLPALPKLPMAVPRPELTGKPSERYPWPFVGYGFLPGRRVDRAELTPEQRAKSARPLGEFLKALHAAPATNAKPDSFDRLESKKMRQRIGERLRDLDVEPPDFLAAPVREPRGKVLVHGDLHARQLLVDDQGVVCAVIDWGDVHAGDPACDLCIAHTFLPPSARGEFRKAYGEIDEATWALARLRGLHLAAALGVYAKNMRDQPLLREALAGIQMTCTS
jgi:aminoglycoside phosphotransferase (APT) family kinase protein